MGVEQAVDQGTRRQHRQAGQKPEREHGQKALAEQIQGGDPVPSGQDLGHVAQQALVLAERRQHREVDQAAQDRGIDAVAHAPQLAGDDHLEGERGDRTGRPPGDRPADQAGGAVGKVRSRGGRHAGGIIGAVRRYNSPDVAAAGRTRTPAPAPRDPGPDRRPAGQRARPDRYLPVRHSAGAGGGAGRPPSLFRPSRTRRATHGDPPPE